MKTHLIALAVGLLVTGLAIFVVDRDMRDGAERAQLANTETERVVVSVQKQDAQVAAAPSAFAF
jgi:hypothetical protein